jgi:hypothetical protein
MNDNRTHELSIVNPYALPILLYIRRAPLARTRERPGRKNCNKANTKMTIISKSKQAYTQLAQETDAIQTKD